MKRRLIICTLLLLLISGSVLAWVYRAPLTHFYHTHIVKTPSPEDDKPKPDPVRYKALIAELAQKRETLSKRYTESRTEDETDQVLAETRALLEETLPQLMRCWLGTDYDFNGTTDTPGTGKIACGYYVSTVMRDAGFRVERFKLAQQPSQRIIGTFLPKEDMIVHPSGYEKFLDRLVKKGPGISIVGLDTHVAFLVVTPELDVRFIHSSGGYEKCVVDQDRETARTLKNSKYRVTGHLTQSTQLLQRWLTGQHWPTHLKKKAPRT